MAIGMVIHNVGCPPNHYSISPLLYIELCTCTSILGESIEKKQPTIDHDHATTTTKIPFYICINSPSVFRAKFRHLLGSDSACDCHGT
jgi:hypothetical protein